MCVLTDMGSLTFQVGLGHMTDSSMVIGQAVVPSLNLLSTSSPLKGYTIATVHMVAHVHVSDVCTLQLNIPLGVFR